jgi:hypothetical protein
MTLTKAKKAAKIPRRAGRPLKEGYDESDMLIGWGRGLGLPNDQVAALANVAEATVQRRKDAPFPSLCATKAAEALSRFKTDVEMDIRKEFERRYGKALRVVDKALDAVDRDGNENHAVQLKASEVVFDRTLGKPTTRAEINAETTVTNVFVLPTETLARLSYITEKLAPAQLAGAVEAEVVEVEETTES